ncbi:MAG: CPBP family intramembrane glutamic endopeptidase [Verrucomicrobiota bacterium]
MSRSNTFRCLELLGLFLGFPVALYFMRHDFRAWVIVTILVFATGCTIALVTDKTFDRRRLWNVAGLKKELGRILLLLLVLTSVPVIYLALTEPERLFAFPRRALVTWVFVMVLYPILSAYPQEIIFRTFFFHRYRELFKSERMMIIASALAFGLAHVFLANWIAPVFATAGGLLFGWTYARSQSTLAAGLEHALWGNVLFTTGLGWYFYAGSIGAN